MADVNIYDFVSTINDILKESDPYEITARDVRRKLEQKFEVDLTPRKHEVQNLIDRCFDDLDIGGEDVEPKESKKQKKHSNSEEKLKKSSPEKSSKKIVRPKGRPPKTQVVQPKKVKIQSDDSFPEDEYPAQIQKKKRGRKPKSSSVKVIEYSDAEYERKFEEELLNESNEKKSSKSKSNGTTSKKKSNKRKKRDDDEQDGVPKKKKKQNTGIHKPLILSSVLAEFLQAEEMSRLEVVKRLWAYIKENELQDPNDKRFIVCDERLMSIFKKDRIHSFTMNKFLTDHLKKKEAPTGANIDVKNANGTSNNHRTLGKGNELDDISRDVKVKIEPHEDWANNDDDGLFEDDDEDSDQE